MESLAQKKARANFKKAIAYRKKTGCSLKEAFAHVSGKKVVTKKTVVKKRSSSPLKKKKVIVKVGTIKKKAVKKPSEKSVLKSIKNAENIQKRHMSINGLKKIGTLQTIEKGDILVCKWGYDQTNVDFYIVTKKTRLGISFIPMSNIIVEFEKLGYGGKVMPGEPKFSAKPINRKVYNTSGELFVKIESYSYARKWNGKPQTFSTYG
jgi:hypothetical protein